MDFAFDDDQQEVRSLAARILVDASTPERLAAAEGAGAGDDGLDRELYSALGAAGLLGLPFPEDVGGAGLSFLETCIVLEELGRRAAPALVLESVVLGGLAVDAFGSGALRQELLPPMIEGRSVLTAALAEEHADPLLPATTARPAGAGGGGGVGGWRLDGVKVCVPAGMIADAVLVPATIAGEARTSVFVVRAGAAGVTREPQATTTGRPEARLTLDRVVVGAGDRLGAGDGGGAGAGDVLGWLVERATAGFCIMAAGVCEEALRLTAAYVQERHQFGRALATFQAVGQRAADAYVDTMAVRLTAWQAAWRLSAGLPAADEVAIAKFWAAEGGQRVVHAAQHLHGGAGVDRSYPLHRYFLLAKQIELSLGGASPQLAVLGRRIAAGAGAGGR